MTEPYCKPITSNDQAVIVPFPGTSPEWIEKKNSRKFHPNGRPWRPLEAAVAAIVYYDKYILGLEDGSQRGVLGYYNQFKERMSLQT